MLCAKHSVICFPRATSYRVFSRSHWKYRNAVIERINSLSTLFSVLRLRLLFVRVYVFDIRFLVIQLRIRGKISDTRK